MSKLFVEAEGHWRGDPDQFCGRLLIEVKATADASNLAEVFGLLKDGDPEALAKLAESAAALDPAFS